ncbi:hypothetical protein PV733_36655 [Streptomyces europaeiscabiei]|uniref:hypothetical protein n=1 Tax=Streptomyces europaeiscabiei TaxID=146819 RepID=UPI0029B3B422|nr:hypothetical protein [Streptomyces europaeiscabiei]MDX3714362.1 hypothetical protein [Streptomyces europaeiscabiei]
MTTSLQTPTVEQLAWRTEQDARERNERAYRVTVDIRDLPSLHVAYQATATAVLVSATDMNVIADWLFVMDGTITTVDLPSGQTVWTLHTQTWTDSPEKFPSVPVFVSVVQLTGAPVMHEIAAAVSR